MKRRRAVIIVIFGALAIAALSWVAGSRLTSPADLAAATKAPTPSLVTAPVEERVLSSNVVVRGVIRHALPLPVTLPASPLKATGGTVDRTVTVAPVRGTVVAEGDLLMAVGGRPVLVLGGSTPMYRDVVPGTSGADVVELQAALARLGFLRGKQSGTIDAATESAIRAWYSAHGYEPLAPSETHLAALRAARDSASQAADRVAQADTTLLSTQRTRQADLLTARTERSTAEDALRAAQATEELARAGALGSTDPQTQRDLQRATAAVDAARDRLSAATAKEQLLASPADNNALLASRDIARKQLSAANSEIARLSLASGVSIPVDEVVFLPQLPRLVDDVKVHPGDLLAADSITMTAPDLVVESGLLPADARVVTVGAKALIEEPDLGVSAPGTVTRVAPQPGTDGADAQHHALTISVEGVAPELVGSSVKVTISVTSTTGPVLAVPLTAVSLAPDGSSRVSKLDARGKPRTVTVKVGLVAQGLVEVIPEKGQLAAGDQVVVTDKGSK